MNINHEHEAIKDVLEEMHYRGYDQDEMFNSVLDQFDITEDELSELIIEVEHRVNDVPNEGFYIEEPNPFGN